MLCKLMKAMGFTEKRHSWDEFDESIKIEAMKKFLTSAIIFMLAIIYFISSKSLTETAVFLLLALVLLYVAWRYVMVFVYGRYVLVIGECVELTQQARTTAKIIKRIGKCSMVIKADNLFVNVPINYSIKFRTGATYAVYVDDRNVFQKDNDYYQIINPLAISVVSRNGSFQKDNKKAP